MEEIKELKTKYSCQQTKDAVNSSNVSNGDHVIVNDKGEIIK